MEKDIQNQGAQAARNGWSLFDCPYLRAQQMPGHTGEPISEWRAKVAAWEAGWKTEVESWLGRSQPPSVVCDTPVLH
ncbi:CrpP-related protein [Achromobacter sp. ESBL13]|uniref:CrpP-related protein n=1 Tax=Achromobacter sp. ESBL13 TaxID=3077328 RepID=UPI002FC922D9